MTAMRWKSFRNWDFDAASNYTAGNWIGDTSQSVVSASIPLKPGGGFGSAGGNPMRKSPKLTTLVSFTGADGADPYDSLIADSSGDLFGTTARGGADGVGAVFEITKTDSGYASAPTILVSFGQTGGEYPLGSLITDSSGDLFGTTSAGSVFEIAKTEGGYANAATTLVTFTGADGEGPRGSLIADAAGDLFGTTADGGADGGGTVFEIAKTQSGYATTPTILVSFTHAEGARPFGSLIADAEGDLFGTTETGGTGGDGAVFEIVKTKHGYKSAPTILVNFTGVDGAQPVGSLIADAAGNLFGTTAKGGADGDGTVFEIVKTEGGYASAPTTLVSFTGSDGEEPGGSLIADAVGDLFGTTQKGGADGDGTIFEIAKSESGYTSAPTTLVSLKRANGMYPDGGLIADGAGDLFGTTRRGGADGAGTVFEITDSGYVTQQQGLKVPAADVTPAPSVAHFAGAMAAITGRGVTVGMIDARTINEGRQMMLTVPRLAIA